MSNQNLVIQSGNLADDPDVRFFPSGEGKVSMRLAINTTYTDRNGDKQKKTEFFSWLAYGDQVEKLRELKKGAWITFYGRPTVEKWTDKETEKGREAVKFVVDAFQLHKQGGSEESTKDYTA